MRNWLQRHATLVVGLGTTVILVGIGLAAAVEPTRATALITARQLCGLTALGFLLAASLIGPLTAVLPRVPLAAVLLAARRAIGVSVVALAIPHVLCYALPTLLRSWRELFAPGWWWTIGLSLGLLAALDLAVLAWTSRDAAVRWLGGQRWKRLHRTVYLAVPLVFLHALLVGADFGFALPPHGEADQGCLIAFSLLTAAWLCLAWLRGRGIRWPARALTAGDSTRTSEPSGSP